jgi:hypothetical protein
MEMMVCLALVLIAFMGGYTLGHAQGRIEGACQETCGEATAGLGDYAVEGMTCRCVYPEYITESGQ